MYSDASETVLETLDKLFKSSRFGVLSDICEILDRKKSKEELKKGELIDRAVNFVNAGGISSAYALAKSYDKNNSPALFEDRDDVLNSFIEHVVMFLSEAARNSDSEETQELIAHGGYEIAGSLACLCF